MKGMIAEAFELGLAAFIVTLSLFSAFGFAVLMICIAFRYFGFKI